MLLIYKFNNIEIIIYRWLIQRIIKILQQYKLKDTGDIWFLLKRKNIEKNGKIIYNTYQQQCIKKIMYKS